MKPLTKSTLVAALLVPSIGYCGISSDMDSFFSGTANITNPQVTNSQMGGLYTGGSLSLRTPSKTVTPFSLSLPTFSAGCNGIDVFAGAFSHISSDQLIALGKAIASNAAPFAFDLAVSTLSPAIKQAYEKLRELASMINQMQINSCEQSTALVANAWPFEANKAVTSSVCKSLGRRRGYFTDGAAEKYNCDNKGKGPSVAAEARKDSEFKDAFQDNTNATWSALGKSSPITDTEMKRLIMTLVGTVVNRAVTTDSAQPKFQYLNPKGSDEKYIEAFLYGGEINLYQCKDGYTECLDVEEDSDTTTIPESKSFVTKVENIIESLEETARSQDQSMTPVQLNFLNRTTLPIYKMILVDIAYSRGGSASTNPQSYAEVVALDYFYNYIDSLIESTYQIVMKEYGSSDQKSIESWRNDIRAVQKRIREKVNSAKENVDVHMKMMQRTMQLEKMMASDVTNQVMGAFNQSKQW